MSSLAQYVHIMNNRELNGLAQNRFTDTESQVELARHPYLRARQYLAANPNLSPEAREILLEGKASSVKWEIVASGHLNHDPDRIYEVYNEAKDRFRQPWRVQRAFLSGDWWGYRASSTFINSPEKLIREIYDNYAVKTHSSDYHGYYSRNIPQAVLRHPNCPEDIAVIMSTSSDPKIQALGFEALVNKKRRSQEQKTT